MYALGVNLARQLGDVRPLVETGQELAQVAKGLLDTVVGRLSETGQVSLLSRRGAELNQLITSRAYVPILFVVGVVNLMVDVLMRVCVCVCACWMGKWASGRKLTRRLFALPFGF